MKFSNEILLARKSVDDFFFNDELKEKLCPLCLLLGAGLSGLVLCWHSSYILTYKLGRGSIMSMHMDVAAVIR